MVSFVNKFKDYYESLQHNYGTRNKGFSVRISKMRTEDGKKSEWFNDAKVNNISFLFQLK